MVSSVVEDFSYIADRLKDLSCPVSSMASFLPAGAEGVLFVFLEKGMNASVIHRAQTAFNNLLKDRCPDLKVIVLDNSARVELLTRDQLKNIQVQIGTGANSDG